MHGCDWVHVCVTSSKWQQRTTWLFEGQQQSGISWTVLHVSCYLVDYPVVEDFGRRCCGFLSGASVSYGDDRDCNHHETCHVVTQLLDHLL